MPLLTTCPYVLTMITVSQVESDISLQLKAYFFSFKYFLSNNNLFFTFLLVAITRSLHYSHYTVVIFCNCFNESLKDILLRVTNALARHSASPSPRNNANPLLGLRPRSPSPLAILFYNSIAPLTSAYGEI